MCLLAKVRQQARRVLVQLIQVIGIIAPLAHIRNLLESKWENNNNNNKWIPRRKELVLFLMIRKRITSSRQQAAGSSSSSSSSRRFVLTLIDKPRPGKVYSSDSFDASTRGGVFLADLRKSGIAIQQGEVILTVLCDQSLRKILQPSLLSSLCLS